VLKAIQAGKPIFVEKPLCRTREELLAIEDALQEAGDSAPWIVVGFNRRFSPAAVLVKEFFAAVRDPLTISVRFNAGTVPAEEWIQQEEVGGGRIVGEACHAIDLATYLAGSPPVRVFAESIGGPNAPEITDDQCFITLRHANGSVSSIAYLAGGDRALPKERIEVFGGGRAAVIDDFRTVVTGHGGKVRTRKLRRQDKGHQAEIEAFARAAVRGGPPPISWNEIQAVTLASFLAVQSLREGSPQELGQG
jgi:predicted dehydrogenase